MPFQFKPYELRGNLNRKQYFEGWFQKIYLKELQVSMIIIYGYATRNTEDTTGFIQLILPGNNPLLLLYPKSLISWDTKKHIIQIGNNYFSPEKIKIQTNEMQVDLQLVNNQVIKTFRNSMGYHYFIPNLPCYHSIMNRSHLVSGEIYYQDNSYSLNSDWGYWEKNWGTSFPENYCWIHAVDPKNEQVSLLFSTAEIKWLGKSFKRHLGHIRLGEREIDLRELKGFTLEILLLTHNNHVIRISSNKIHIDISITIQYKAILKGPEEGNLSRDILHHTDATIDVFITENEMTSMYQMIGNYENISSDAKG
jgi:tocopherol cyclase